MSKLIQFPKKTKPATLTQQLQPIQTEIGIMVDALLRINQLMREMLLKEDCQHDSIPARRSR